jgi:hypothetical protein
MYQDFASPVQPKPGKNRLHSTGSTMPKGIPIIVWGIDIGSSVQQYLGKVPVFAK